MRTTVSVDDKLMDTLRVYTGETENAAIIRAALKGFVEREAARRLILLGGSDPEAKAAPRRRSKLR
ncbi:MAG TPA: type II toxin-antitoxin system VapB family antitoxin [Stellaceae bacterium]|nr:type II toxin-antitoxin system VapB family antitoxin [Stellaceae bacterium]